MKFRLPIGTSIYFAAQVKRDRIDSAGSGRGTNIATVLFEERPLGLYLINMGYQLIACAIAGVILALWRPRAVAESGAPSN